MKNLFKISVLAIFIIFISFFSSAPIVQAAYSATVSLHNPGSSLVTSIGYPGQTSNAQSISFNGYAQAKWTTFGLASCSCSYWDYYAQQTKNCTPSGSTVGTNVLSLVMTNLRNTVIDYGNTTSNYLNLSCVPSTCVAGNTGLLSTSGSWTWTYDSAHANCTVKMEAWGPGGGGGGGDGVAGSSGAPGGNGGGGGGGGQYRYRTVSADLNSDFTGSGTLAPGASIVFNYNVPAGGTGGAGGNTSSPRTGGYGTSASSDTCINRPTSGSVICSQGGGPGGPGNSGGNGGSQGYGGSMGATPVVNGGHGGAYDYYYAGWGGYGGSSNGGAQAAAHGFGGGNSTAQGVGGDAGVFPGGGGAGGGGGISFFPSGARSGGGGGSGASGAVRFSWY